VLVGYANERIFGGVERTLRASLIGLSIISLVALAAAWLGAESMIVNRISRIVAVADRMREGDLAVRTGMTDDTSEFGQLAVTLDSLAAALQERRSDNERLLGQMRLLNSELEERVVERTRQLVKSNERLLASQAELRRLSHQLMRATEQERTRISREIHDQLGQMLTAIKIELRSARRRLADKEGSALAAEALAPDALAVAVTKLDDTSRMLDEMVVLVRRIAADLRPGLLDDFGLAAAVDWQLQEFRKVSGVEYTLDADLDESRLTPNQATAAFRILQESLTNVARHAHATAVDVQLSMDDHGLMLQVQDNGRGLPTDGSSRPRSLGLLGMRERAVELGGAVEISSASGQGTAVNLWLPLDAGATDSDWSADTPVHGADVDLADDGASAGPPALMAPSAPSPL
jgi:signal transduction histidine kinase